MARPADVTEIAVRDEVWAAAEQDFLDDQWDDAVFAAFRGLEATVQQRIASSQIGAMLAKAAFNPDAGNPPVDLSGDPRDRKDLERLFAGAVGFFKGSRSHGQSPDVPCPSREACVRVLAMVSALYDLLDLDQAVAPAIAGVRSDQDGSLEIFGDRVTPTTGVLIDGAALPVISRAGAVLRVHLEAQHKPPFKLTLRDGSRHSRVFRLDALPLPGPDDNFHRVAEAELTVWADELGSVQLPLKAVAISSHEGMRSFIRFFPTDEKYAAGDHVSWDWNMDKVAGPGWVRRAGEFTPAWTSAAYFAGRILAKAGTPRLTRVEVRPSPVRFAPGAHAPIRVIGFMQDGPAVWREDLTDKAQLSIADAAIASMDRRSLTGGQMGRTTLRATVDGHAFEVAVVVSPAIAGEVIPFLGGWKEVRRIARTTTSLLFTTGDETIWEIADDCTVRALVRLDVPDTSPSGVDLFAVGPGNELYVRTLWDGRMLRLSPTDDYQSAAVVAEATQNASYMSAGISPDGSLLLGLSDGVIVRVRERGEPETVLRLPSGAVGLAWRGDAELFAVSSGGRPGYYVISNSMQEVVWVPGPAGALLSPSAVASRDGGVLIADFYAGVVYSISTDNSVDVFARGFTNPTGLAVAADGRVFVSDVSTDIISVVLP